MAKLKQKSQLSEQSKIILQQRKGGKSIGDLARDFNLSRSRIYYIISKHGDTLPKKLQQN